MNEFSSNVSPPVGVDSLFAKSFFLKQKIKKTVYGVNWIFFNEMRFGGRSTILMVSPIDFGDISRRVV
jgi:hypothetical protein